MLLRRYITRGSRQRYTRRSGNSAPSTRGSGAAATGEPGATTRSDQLQENRCQEGGADKASALFRVFVHPLLPLKQRARAGPSFPHTSIWVAVNIALSPSSNFMANQTAPEIDDTSASPHSNDSSFEAPSDLRRIRMAALLST